MPDPISHSCISYVVARHALPRHKLLFVLSGLSPDIDVPVGALYCLLTGPPPESLLDFARQSLIFHPSLTASLFFAPVLALLLVGFFRLVIKNHLPDSFQRTYGIILCGIGLHLALDLLQTGNLPFWPLKIEAGIGVIGYTARAQGAALMAAAGILLLDLAIIRIRRTQ